MTYQNDYPVKDPAKKSSKEMNYDKYRYCLEECEKCNEIALLKKILFELRKLNKKE